MDRAFAISTIWRRATYQPTDDRPWGGGDAQLDQKLSTTPLHLSEVNGSPTRPRLTPGEDVLGYRQVLGKVELLVDDRDTQALGVTR